MDRLHMIEVAILQSLMTQELKDWCQACHLMFRRIHAKATQGDSE